MMVTNAVLLQAVQGELLDAVLKSHATSRLAEFRAEFTPVAKPFSLTSVSTARGERSVKATERLLGAAATVTSETRKEMWINTGLNLNDAFLVHEHEANFYVGEAWEEQLAKVMESNNNNLGGYARGQLYEAGYSGHAYATTTGSVTVITLDNVEGFETKIKSGDYQPTAISASNTLKVYFYISNAWVERTVNAVDSSAKTITVTSAITLSGGKVPVVAETATKMVFVDTTNVCTDDVASGDKLTWEVCMQAKANLQNAGVKPKVDGNYWLYISPKQYADLLTTNAIFAVANMPNAQLQSQNPFIMGDSFAFGGVRFVIADVIQSGIDSDYIYNATALPLENETDVPLEYALMTGMDAAEEGRHYSAPKPFVQGAEVTSQFEGSKIVIKDYAADVLGESVSFGWTWMGYMTVRTNLLSPKTISAVPGKGKAAYSHVCLVVSAGV